MRRVILRLKADITVLLIKVLTGGILCDDHLAVALVDFFSTSIVSVEDADVDHAFAFTLNMNVSAFGRNSVGIPGSRSQCSRLRVTADRQPHSGNQDIDNLASE